jgi:hypothetical protein
MPSNSPYSATTTTGKYPDRFVPIKIYPDIDDFSYTVENKYNGRPDKLAFDKYGSSEFWWVFAMRNPALRINPFFGLRTGIIIIIPSLKAITGRGSIV